jgi:hypothetical protein
MTSNSAEGVDLEDLIEVGRIHLIGVGGLGDGKRALAWRNARKGTTGSIPGLCDQSGGTNAVQPTAILMPVGIIGTKVRVLHPEWLGEDAALAGGTVHFRDYSWA